MLSKRGNPARNNDQGQIQSASCPIRQLLTGAEGANPHSAGSRRFFRQPGTCFPLLGHRQRHPHSPAMEGWGAKIIDSLADDLPKAFPGMTGFGARNLKYMRAFAEAYPDQEFVQQVVAQLPWGHNVRILDMVKDAGEREWYIRQAVRGGWTRNVLVHQIESDLFTAGRARQSRTFSERSLPLNQNWPRNSSRTHTISISSR